MTDNKRRVAEMTGLSVPKSRRGKRSRGKGKQAQHFADLKSSMASGDHASAKVSALHLAKALHAIGKKGKSSLPSPEAKGLDPAEINDGPAAYKGTGDPS